MYDHELFVRTLSEFTAKLLTHYEVDEVLGDLAERLTGLFALAGSGVTVGVEGRLRVAVTVPPHLTPLEKYQEERQDGPCVEAYRTGEVVAVPDLAEVGPRWPGYGAVAAEVGMRSVVGVPMKLGEQSVGALNMYQADPRQWQDDELAAARVLANMATAYLINASSFNKQAQLSEQLQRALDTRVVIEQAKGVLAEANGTDVDAAFERLRRHARNHNVKVHDVAAAVVGLGLRP